ncbi:MAG: preprotein translocase subunit SecE [Oscillospiraceae bacterium]
MSEEKRTAAPQKPAKKTPAKAKSKQPHRRFKFFKELKGEMKKVVWPSRKKVINNTSVVLTLMVIIGLFLAGVDFCVGLGLDKLLSIGA